MRSKLLGISVMAMGAALIFGITIPLNIQIGDITIYSISVGSQRVVLSLGLEIRNNEPAVLQIFDSDIDIRVNSFTLAKLRDISGTVGTGTSSTLGFSVEISWNLFELAGLSKNEVLTLGFVFELVGKLGSSRGDLPVQRIIEISAEMLWP